jgi:hypothetical protein
MKMSPYHALYRRKLLIALCALSMLLINVSLADGSLRKNVPEIKIVEPTHPSAPTGVEGAFESVWIEHDVKVKGVRGMQIHAKFTVKNGLKVHCLMEAYFFNKDRAPLKTESRYTQYKNAEGDVSVNTTFTPRFDSSEYADQKLFLPYSALNLKESGVHELKLYLILVAKGSKFAQSSWYNFIITKD